MRDNCISCTYEIYTEAEKMLYNQFMKNEWSKSDGQREIQYSQNLKMPLKTLEIL